MTIVDRETRCFLAIQAVFQRGQDIGQQMLRQAPAEQYYSDMFPMYDSLSYRKGYHLALSDKSETYSVEADNAVEVNKSFYGLIFGKYVFLSEDDFFNPYAIIAFTGVIMAIMYLILRTSR